MPEREKDKYVHFPNTHKARKGRKIMDWQFRCNKPIWFLGDSNWYRMPPHCSGEIQIDSYPGASFYHSWKRPLRMHWWTWWCCRWVLTTDTRTHIKRPLNSLECSIGRLSLSFPSPEFAQKCLPVISRIAEDQFHTATDNIHWTQETAGWIFKHWCSELQLDF